uniref:Uncharacterized protein n=1 Tax=mine drainage metagenome TaxID=410659 RepID=E6PK22_9ZZZZ
MRNRVCNRVMAGSGFQGTKGRRAAMGVLPGFYPSVELRSRKAGKLSDQTSRHTNATGTLARLSARHQRAS